MAKNRKRRGGYLTLELLIALAVFAAGLASIGYLIVDSGISASRSAVALREEALLREGLEVVRLMRDGDFDALAPGTYGLALAGGTWTIAAAPEVIGPFTREVAITGIPPDTIRVSVRIFGTGGANAHKAEQSLHFTDHLQTEGSAGDLAVDLDNLSYGQAFKELNGIAIENTGMSGVTLASMTLWWEEPPPARVTSITIGGTEVWRGNASSGTLLDIDDVLLQAGGTALVDAIQFNKNMNNVNIMMLFTPTDGSTKYAAIFPQ